MMPSAYETFCYTTYLREPKLKEEWDRLEQQIGGGMVNNHLHVLVDYITDFNKVRLESLGYTVVADSNKIKISWDLRKEVEELIIDTVLDKHIIPTFIKIL
jgi:hypothetical protein